MSAATNIIKALIWSIALNPAVWVFVVSAYH